MRIDLPQVTICAVSSVNIAATLRALETCLEHVEPAACLFFTDEQLDPPHPAIRIVPIARITSSAAYSDFVLNGIVEHISTSHCLVVQWDGHIRDAACWNSRFLVYDYVGASWPQFNDGGNVGNGGFSLRSRRLMKLCLAPEFKPAHPEDTAICRDNRAFLEARGIRFAPVDLADAFSAERSGDPANSFGYHGVFLMPQVLGSDNFWQIYEGLDDLGTVRHDFWLILLQVLQGRKGTRRAIRMMLDRARRGRRR